MNIRTIKPSDSDRVVYLIKRLASYEKAAHEVELSTEQFRSQIELTNPPFECLVAEVDGKIVGFALYFYKYSTWKGSQVLHLEDMFVLPKYRSRGIAKSFFSKLLVTATDKKCCRVEWSCLKCNTIAIGFYRAIGASSMDEWDMWRISLS